MAGKKSSRYVYVDVLKLLGTTAISFRNIAFYVFMFLDIIVSIDNCLYKRYIFHHTFPE